MPDPMIPAGVAQALLDAIDAGRMLLPDSNVTEALRAALAAARADPVAEERDALQAMVDGCRELVRDYAVSVKSSPIASAAGLHDELEQIVGWPGGALAAARLDAAERAAEGRGSSTDD